MSDVDEIPSGHTIDLLRWCDDIPPKLHLHLRNYLYSFEFVWAHRSWRASVHRYRTGETTYAHYRQSDFLLSDSGWHCSFCFRHINDFIFKMKAYSHYDRVKFSHFLNPTRIQDIICKGGDLYDMLPEEYTFKEIIGNLGNLPHSFSAVHLPAFLLENAEKYKYLLPGNCIREWGNCINSISDWVSWKLSRGTHVKVLGCRFSVAPWWTFHWMIYGIGMELIQVYCIRNKI